MKDLSAVEDKETLKYVIRHELKSFGIKVPKGKRSSVRCTQAQGKERPNCASSVFGCPLDEIPTTVVNATPGCIVPKFLVDCVQFLTGNIDCEGLFRKPGSRPRQKELQRIIENDGPIPSDAHIHDVAGLFKLFFRELPEPLINNKLTEALIKCRQLGNSQELQYTTVLLCLTLPPLHLHTLRYAMQFLKKVAASVESNKMDAANLALVMTPNFVGSFKTEKSGNAAATEKLLRLQTLVVRHLIEHAEDIGMVPDAVVERVESFGNRSGDLLADRLTSEDELDKSGDTTLEDRRKNRRRRRSGPIQGIMSGIGQSLGILKSGAGSAVVKTPATDEVIENPSFLGETPRILRSSKRKASEDLGAFSSAKRKAMLQQMTVDPHYSKPGLNLHREGRRGPGDSPITPIRPSRPALGEVDAVTEDGEMVFKFETPSIKFADDSFTTFCATPPGKADMTGVTPGKKLGKLKPLSSKKYKRRSGAMHVDISTPKSVYASNTPKSGSVYESIKKRLGHRHTRTQPTPIQLNDMPDKSVGWRLANPPMQEGSAVQDSHALGSSPNLKRTPLMRRRRRQKMPSSPATLFVPHSTLSQPLHDQRGKGQSPSHVKGEGSAMGIAVDSDSPKVVVVDLNSTALCPETSRGDISSTYMSCEFRQNNSSDGLRETFLDDDVDTKNVDDHTFETTEEASEGVGLSPGHVSNKGSLRPKTNMESGDCRPSEHEACSAVTAECQSLQHSISQKSLSSVLSQVSVDSAKSVFSVEIDYETAGSLAATEDTNDATVQNDITVTDAVTPTGTECNFQLCQINVEEVAGTTSEEIDYGASSVNKCHNTCEDYDDADGSRISKEYAATTGSLLCLDSTATTTMAVSDANACCAGSMSSLESVDPDEKHPTGSSRRLIKSVSVDSGKGQSLDDLACLDEVRLEGAVEKRIASERGIKSAQGIPPGLVKMMSDRLSPVEDASEESSCSISSEDNPQFRETKAFWKLAKSGHIFNKSLSDSQVNSPARKTGQALLSPSRSYHSQIHLEKRDRLGPTMKRSGDSSFSSSMVKSNIDLFNSMCQQTSPVRNLRSKQVHQGGYQGRGKTAQRSSPSKGSNAEIQTSKYEPARVSPKTNLTKSVSIDSGMCQLGGSSNMQGMHPITKTTSRGHDDSYEIALIQGSMIEIPRDLQEIIDDTCTPRLASRKNEAKYKNAEEMPVHDGDQDGDQIPDHLAPVHALHNESLTPLKLASSTIIRTPGKRALKIKHRSPLKHLQIPQDNITPTLRETRSHKRYPCSPKNPLMRPPSRGRHERSHVPDHVRDDMDVVEL